MLRKAKVRVDCHSNQLESILYECCDYTSELKADWMGLL